MISIQIQATETMLLFYQNIEKPEKKTWCKKEKKNQIELKLTTWCQKENLSKKYTVFYIRNGVETEVV